MSNSTGEEEVDVYEGYRELEKMFTVTQDESWPTACDFVKAFLRVFKKNGSPRGKLTSGSPKSWGNPTL